MADVVRGCDFGETDLQWLLVGGPQRPLGDVFAAERFLADRFRRIRYVHFMGWLIGECASCLRGAGAVAKRFGTSSPGEITEAIDPLLEYLLSALRYVLKSEQGPGAAGKEAVRHFDSLPRDRCGPKARRAIAVIEGDRRLVEFMMRFRDQGD